MLRRLGRLLLAVAILFATQGALEHPLVHVKAGHAEAHAHEGFDGEHPQDVAETCDTCVAFAGLAIDTGSRRGQRPVDTASVASVSVDGAHLPRAPPVFLSQAPPLLS